MNETVRRSPWILIASLVIVGSCSATLALWLVDHRLAVRQSGLVLGFAMAFCLICFAWALLQYIAWRDHLRGRTAASRASTIAGNRITDPNVDGTV